MSAMTKQAFALLLSLASLAGSSAISGCGGSIEPGTLRGPAPMVPAAPRRPQVTLTVAPIDDVRPSQEHEGDSVRTRLFIFFGVGVHVRREGNYVTDDFAASANAPSELRELAIAQLSTAGVAKSVTNGGASDFELRLKIEHLYGTHFAANKETIVVLSSRNSSDAMVDVHARNYAAYGNVTLWAELVDRRGAAGAQPRVVWSEHVTGYAQRPAGERRVAEVQAAVQLASADALATLSQRVGAALDRLAVGPSGQPMQLAPGATMPSAFAIERMSRYRDFLERVFVETATGRVLKHVILPAPDRYASRPGDWLLSRVTAEELQLSPDGYEAFARVLSGRYDLRVVDDAAHYHFFGLLGVAPPPAATVP
jgi:hypothetical protein